MIIQSTTLDTEAKVKAIYGQNTQWISHSGYVLRGATSGVVANDNVKTGGSDTHTITESELPSHTHSIPALSGTAASAGSHRHVEAPYLWFASSGGNLGYTGGSAIMGSKQYTEYAGAHTHSVTTNASTTGAKGSGSAMSTLNNYKSVYIWERIA